METFARKLLNKLLSDGEKSAAGVRSRQPILTALDLSEYRKTESLKDKDGFEAVMRAARAHGAIKVIWDHGKENEGSPDDFIERVKLDDLGLLADFMGQRPRAAVLSEAVSALTPHYANYPVLVELCERWSSLRTVRRCGPEDVKVWLDAIRVLCFARELRESDAIALPIREASYRIFRDTKLLEKLAPAVDVLLANDLDAVPRAGDEVWKEIGLFREEQPIRLSGKITVVRERVTAVLDAPYGAFAAPSLLRIADVPDYVTTIENLTTFHSEARRLCNEKCLLIYTGGTPSPAWRAMYKRLLTSIPETVPVRHWGDVDEGGFRIAALIAEDAKLAGKTLRPWRMHPDDIPEDLRRAASDSTVARMCRYALAAGWPEISTAVEDAKMTVEQEGLS
ncbi:DUF2399 domain-containing protein [Duganella radicis]|uniref:DUF2399 domain-containing protein n=1 Tax=Duganella radicis TaxID=551988 RepID=A0A6L6PRD7_9BURK|nr:DUF2399 domain-containing protein [Duganella radicis]MTV41678.1 DUF2399 domain-containing protein [Duganella radicis]